MKHFAVVITAAAFLLTACDTDATTVGPDGGIVISEDGRLALDIPAGALTSDVDITVGQVEGPPQAAGPTYELLPQGIGFTFPAEIAYDLNGEQVGETPWNQLRLITDKGDQWGLLADQDVDMASGVVVASATFLSTYTVVAR